MKEQYLWDRSGPPDPEIEALERSLAKFRFRENRGQTDLSTTIAPAPSFRIRRGTDSSVPGVSRWAAAAAVVVAAIGISQFSAPRTAWQIAGMNVRRGQVLRTGDSGVQLQADTVGRVDLAPNSELRATGEKRLELKRGELHAFIWAPAREFVVDTPSARAVDLGCQYTLNVDEKGDGLLRVSTGWVAFDAGGKESFIPAGAECRTHKRGGPGIPWFEDAPEEFRAALADYERGDRAALDRLLRAARPRDGLTLWHLMTRAGQDRSAVYDRFAALIQVSAVTREGVLRGDAGMIDRCWNALELENTGWWRGWERRWAE